MSRKPFYGIDEFTSYRIRRAASSPSALTELGVTRGEAAAAETRMLSGVDPFDVAAEVEGDRDPSFGGHVRAMRIQKAMIDARLEHLGDLREGMTVGEVKAWMAATPFALAYQEELDCGRGIFAIWGEAETGIIVYGQVYSGGRHELKMSLQWSPDLESMSEEQESQINVRLENILGRGELDHSWFNPSRPELNHSALHYAHSYPDVVGEEKSAWEEDYRVVPASVLRERGGWVAVLTCRIGIGLLTPINALIAQGGTFQSRWHACLSSSFAARDIFGRARHPERASARIVASAGWLKEIVHDAYSFDDS